MGDKRQDSRWKVAQESPGPIAFNVEGLSLTVGKKVLSRSDLKVRMLDAKGKPLPGRYLLKSTGPDAPRRIAGDYEVELPATRLTAAVKKIKVSWLIFTGVRHSTKLSC